MIRRRLRAANASAPSRPSMHASKSRTKKERICVHRVLAPWMWLARAFRTVPSAMEPAIAGIATHPLKEVCSIAGRTSRYLRMVVPIGGRTEQHWKRRLPGEAQGVFLFLLFQCDLQHHAIPDQIVGFSIVCHAEVLPVDAEFRIRLKPALGLDGCGKADGFFRAPNFQVTHHNMGVFLSFFGCLDSGGLKGRDGVFGGIEEVRRAQMVVQFAGPVLRDSKSDSTES